VRTKSDAEVVRAAVSTPAAFEQIVLRHHGVVYRYIVRRLGPADADDLTSEVFAVAFARRRDYDGAYPNARPWLFGIATNLIRHHARREAAALRAFAVSGVDPVAPERPESDGALSAAVAGALAAMRPRHRDVLFLHAVAELTDDEIAVALGVPVGTVKGWLHRARRVAAKELAIRGVAPPSALSSEPKAVEP
jgi:RNA polymerase sigma factor (sigma-70 family)